jgi:hypothetical protein
MVFEVASPPRPRLAASRRRPPPLSTIISPGKNAFSVDKKKSFVLGCRRPAHTQTRSTIGGHS